MKASSTGHRPRTVRLVLACVTRVCVRGEQHRASMVWVHYPGRLHKRPGLHIAFMMQRRPALAANNGSTIALLSSTPSAPPRLLRYFFYFFPSPSLSRFSSGNRLVKVITLITHLPTKYTFSHLFLNGLGGRRSSSRVPFPRLSLARSIIFRIADSSRKFLLPRVASGAK